MTKIEPLNNAAFLLNGIPQQRGAGRIQVSGNLVGIAETSSDTKNYVSMQEYTEFIDAADQPFASVEDLILYLGNTILI